MKPLTLSDRVVLIEAELTIAVTHEKDDPNMSLQHLERAKHELCKAVTDLYKSFHTSGVPY